MKFNNFHYFNNNIFLFVHLILYLHIYIGIIHIYIRFNRETVNLNQKQNYYMFYYQEDKYYNQNQYNIINLDKINNTKFNWNSYDKNKNLLVDLNYIL